MAIAKSFEKCCTGYTFCVKSVSLLYNIQFEHKFCHWIFHCVPNWNVFSTCDVNITYRNHNIFEFHIVACSNQSPIALTHARRAALRACVSAMGLWLEQRCHKFLHRVDFHNSSDHINIVPSFETYVSPGAGQADKQYQIQSGILCGWC